MVKIVIRKDMKVCIISGYPPNPGRGAELISSFVCTLSKHQDISNILIIGNIGANTLHRERQGKVTVIRAWSPDSWKSLFRIFKVLSNEDFDVVHINYGYLFPGRPLFSSVFILSILFVVKCLRKPSIVTINQVFSLNEVEENREVFSTKLPLIFIKMGFIILNKAISKLACKVVAIHKRHEEILQRIYKIRNVELVPLFGPVSGSNLGQASKFEAKRALGLEGKRVLLIFGFIVPFKGIEYAIKAMTKIIKEFPDTVLIIAGSIPPSLSSSNEAKVYINQIKCLIKTLNLQTHVRFKVGYVPEAETMLYFTASDLVIIPNVKQSGPSEVLRKAIVYRIPVIATNVGYNKYDVVNGFTGILVPPHDSEALARAIINLFSEERTYLNICKYLEEISHQYSVENTVCNMIKLYKQCLDNIKSHSDFRRTL